MAEPKPRSPTVMKGVALLLGRGTSAVVADGNEKVDVAEISKPLRWRVAKDPPFELPWKRSEAFFFIFLSDSKKLALSSFLFGHLGA